MSFSRDRAPQVLIIGTGSTSLLIAQGLKKAGIPSVVFEKSDESSYKDRPRHWSMALHWGAEYLSKCLPEDIMEDIRTIESGLVPGESTRRASRAKLRRLLSRGMDVRYRKRLKKIDNDGKDITVYFEDGTSTKGDLLVGCNGAKSAVRANLLPPEQNHLDSFPITDAHIAVSYTAEQAIFIRNAYHPSCVMAPHPDQNTSAFIGMADVEQPDKSETWIFLLNYAIWGTHEQPDSNEERLQLVKNYAANYCEPFKSAVELIPDDTWVPPDVFRVRTNPVKWDNHDGRITIEGDAAHPISLLRGQGLNNAFEDAFHYVEATQSYVKAEKSLKDAIDEYDKETLERGKKEVEISNLQTYGTHHWDTLMQSPLVNKIGLNKAAQYEGYEN